MVAGKGASETWNHGFKCTDPGRFAETNRIKQMHQVDTVQVKVIKTAKIVTKVLNEIIFRKNLLIDEFFI